MLPLSNTNGLANRPLQPLEYFSIFCKSCSVYCSFALRLYELLTKMILAERVGFEPTVPCGITGFQDRLLKPLGHLSTCLSLLPAAVLLLLRISIVYPSTLTQSSVARLASENKSCAMLVFFTDCVVAAPSAKDPAQSALCTIHAHSGCPIDSPSRKNW